MTTWYVLIGATATWETVKVSGIEVPVIEAPCSRCGYPFKDSHPLSNGRCFNCNQAKRRLQFEPEGISRAWGLTTYVKAAPNHPGTRIVDEAKQDPVRTHEMMQAAALRFRVASPWQSGGASWSPDLVTACPSTSAPPFPRAMAMARAVGDVLECTSVDVLVKKPGAVRRSSQAAKPYPRTFDDLCQEGYSTCIGKLMGGERVLLVDDLMTQGATAASAAASLREAGAADVRLLTFAQFTTRLHLEEYCD